MYTCIIDTYFGLNFGPKKDLEIAVHESSSFRQVIKKLNLIPAGGNYVQVKNAIKNHSLSTEHFTGKGWRDGKKFNFVAKIHLSTILVKDSSFQSFKLKQRLFREGLKKPKCELCGLATVAQDGRVPVELDHINGDRNDNRLTNLRILCPNCHSLQSTHRGKNIRSRGGEIGRRATLKML